MSRACAVRVVTPADLSFRHLKDLLAGTVDAVSIPAFVPPGEAGPMAGGFLSGAHSTSYLNLRDGLEKVGSTLFEAASAGGAENDAAVGAYLAQGRQTKALINSIVRPHGEPPMSRVAALFQRAFGARPLEIGSDECFAGLVRVIRDGKEILPHQDHLGEDLPTLEFAARLEGQLAVNIYLQLPEAGGELELWPREGIPAETPRLPGSDYGLDRAFLPSSLMPVKPSVGELLMFDSTRIHAVRPSSGTARVSISFFMGVGTDGTVRYWS